MPRNRPKPGPKSKNIEKKPERPSNIRDLFGDSTLDGEEGQSTESFRSVDLGNQTDYGLELTADQYRITSNNPNSAKTPARRGSLSSASKAFAHTRSAKTPALREFLPSTSTAPPSPRSAARPTPRSAATPNPRSVVSGHKRKNKTPQNLFQRREAEIRKLQARTDNLIPRLCFGRLIREMLIANSTFAHRITPTALEALQVSAEMYLTDFFKDAYMCTLHRGRRTLSVSDVKLILFLRGS